MAIISTARSFTFNATIKPEWLLINKMHRPLQPKRDGNFLKVAKRPGAYYFGSSTDVRTITADVTIMADDEVDLWKRGEWVTNWLTQDEPKELIINDEPDRTYYAILLDETELEDLAATGAGTLTFVCPDPYKYGQEYTQDLVANPTILNDANAKIPPRIDVTFAADSTHFAIAKGDKTVIVGIPENVETTKLPEYQIEKNFALNTVTGWTAAGTRLDPGYTVSGTLASDGKVFKPSAYGTASGYHGPALKTSLTTPLQDFRVEALGRLKANQLNQIGRIELYLMDINGKIIAKLAMKDMHKDYENNHGEIRLGETSDYHYMINTPGSRPGTWNDFYGKLLIERKGNTWRAYIARKNETTGEYSARWDVTYTDKNSKFTEPIAQVQLAVLGYSTFNAPPTAEWEDLKVYKINDLTTSQTNVLFKSGDRLTIDNDKKMVFINDDPAMTELSLDSQFLMLDPGPNTFGFSPDTNVTVNATYRKRWR